MTQTLRFREEGNGSMPFEKDQEQTAQDLPEQEFPAEEPADGAVPQEDSSSQESSRESKKEKKRKKEKEPTEEEKLAAQLADLNDKLMRTLAEYDNFRKRSQKEKDAIYPDAVANTVLAFLPVLDNFERALAAECKDADFKKGVELIMNAFKDCLTKLKVEEIAALGEEFDPNLHNAVMHIEDDATADNVIVDVFQKGYKLGDKVIRHAMVKVAN